MTTLTLGFGAAVAPASFRARVPARHARPRALITRARAQETQDEQVRPRASVPARLFRVFAALARFAARSRAARRGSKKSKSTLEQFRTFVENRTRLCFVPSLPDSLPLHHPSTSPFRARRSSPWAPRCSSAPRSRSPAPPPPRRPTRTLSVGCAAPGGRRDRAAPPPPHPLERALALAAPAPAPTTIVPTTDAATVRQLAKRFAAAFFAALAVFFLAWSRVSRVARDALARAERSELGLENAAKELKSALMDLEVLRLALAEAEAKALAESKARAALEARLARETARASSLEATLAARDEKEASASSAAADSASSLRAALEKERAARADLERRVEEERAARADLERRLEEMRAALAEAESRLAEAQSRLAEADSRLADAQSRLAEAESRLADAESRSADAESRSARALTERDIALRRAAMASASAQRSQTADATASIARDAPEMPVRFELRGVPDVAPGYHVVVAGTWCDWDLSRASPMSFEPDDEIEGARYWAADVDMLADDTYEYKYAVTRADGAVAEDARWQAGNNRTLALQFSLARDVALVEVEDRWRSDPKASPILLHHLDGTIEEIGSTQLLRDCIAELRATVRRLSDAVAEADAAAAEEETRVTNAIIAERAAAAATKAAKAPASGAAVARAEKFRGERLAAVDVAAELETAELEASAMAAAEARRLRGETEAPSPR